MDTNHYRVKPGKIIQLKDWDANDKGDVGDRNEVEEKTTRLTNQLEVLQELLFAEHKHKLLVILQGMDTSGKDGVIRHVFDGVNPAGVRVASFKVPTPEEADHDFLWRVHKQVPGKGEIVIFNRSQYEEVLVVRVRSLAPEAVWKRHYGQIKEFERLLVDEGTTIRKFYLHIDPDEQRERFLDRLNEPDSHWKFNPGDLKDRAYWEDYMKAYEDLLNRTSTEEAPWYIVPANKKWFRNLLISSVLVETLQDLDMHYPVPAEDLTPYRQQLLNEKG